MSEENETSLTDVYRCRFEDTGNSVSVLKPFTVPIDIHEPISFIKEREIAVVFPESELVEFLNDFGHFVDILQLARENPIIQEEYNKLLILVGLLK